MYSIWKTCLWLGAAVFWELLPRCEPPGFGESLWAVLMTVQHWVKHLCYSLYGVCKLHVLAERSNVKVLDQHISALEKQHLGFKYESTSIQWCANEGLRVRGLQRCSFPSMCEARFKMLFVLSGNFFRLPQIMFLMSLLNNFIIFIMCVCVCEMCNNHRNAKKTRTLLL